MNFIRRHLPLIILQICTFTILAIALGGFLFNPNERLFNPGGDGIKNYYTFGYHLKYGSGYWFDGMTYPYGEHHLFTDSFAVYAWILNFIDDHIVTLHPYSVGILNLTVLLAFCLCTFFLYKILRHYDIAAWWAVPAALCICFLSPQVRRIEFHYSLALGMYVPMLWWFLLRMLRVPPPNAPPKGEINVGKNPPKGEENGGEKFPKENIQTQDTRSDIQTRGVFRTAKNLPLWRGLGGGLGWGIAIVAGIVFFGLLHPYYLPLGSFFVLAFAGIYLLENIFPFVGTGHALSLRKGGWKTIALLFAVALIPILILGIFTAMTDPVTDRHIAPFGLWVYVSRFEAIFFPNTGHIRTWWDFLHLPQVDMEGMGYVGFWGLPVLVFTVLRGLYFSIKKRNPIELLKFTNQATLNTTLWASILLLILSFALPFIWFGFLLDWVPQLRQFRSLGRFSWAFYYVYGVYMAYLFYQFLNLLLIENKKTWAILAGVVVMGLWANEAGWHLHYTAQTMYKSVGKNIYFKDNNDYGNYLSQTNYKPDDFQAILPIPYFNNGSEKWYIYRDGLAAREAYKCSFETGLPIAALHSPRTSISQAGKLAQMLSSDLIKKRILRDLNDKPLLMIVLNSGALARDESNLIQKANEIFRNDKVTLYEVPLTAFETRFAEINEKYAQLKSEKNTSLELPEYVIRKNFNTQKTPHTFRGEGAANSGDSIQITLHDGYLNAKQFPAIFETSMWVYVDSSQSSFPKLFYYEYNEKGERVGLEVVSPKFETEIYGEGRWAMEKFVFKCQSPRNRVHIYLESEDQKTTGIIGDEWLLRPIETEVFYDEDERSFMYNNYRIPMSE